MGMLKEPSRKYQPFPQVNLPDRQWPSRTITKAPRWLSTDLRDGNQSIIDPMDAVKKQRFFDLLRDLFHVDGVIIVGGTLMQGDLRRLLQEVDDHAGGCQILIVGKLALVEAFLVFIGFAVHLLGVFRDLMIDGFLCGLEVLCLGDRVQQRHAGEQHHQVRDGQSIQEAVRRAVPGDVIQVFPGTYKETVYIDKDDILITGVIEQGKWPTMEGGQKLNDAVLYSGNNITVENLHITHYKGNAIMGQAGNNFLIRNNRLIDTGVYGIFPQLGQNGIVEHNVVSGIADAAIYTWITGDDPQFKALVDKTLAAVYKSPEIEQIYARWFLKPIPPRNVNLNFAMTPAIKEAFASPNDRGVQ